MAESLNEIYEELIHRLYKPLIFYVPRKLFLELDENKWTDKEFDNLFNKLVLIKSDGSNKELGTNPSYFYILGKTTELDKNIFSLIDAKSKYDKESFKFFMTKYKQHIEFYIRITTWLNDNVKKDIKELTQDALNSFACQKEAFLKHREYVYSKVINTNFEDLKAQDENLTDEDIKSIRKLLEGGDINSSDKTKFDKKVIELNQVVKPMPTKKKVLVKEEEAEKFLLKTVFNME